MRTEDFVNLVNVANTVRRDARSCPTDAAQLVNRLAVEKRSKEGHWGKLCATTVAYLAFRAFNSAEDLFEAAQVLAVEEKSSLMENVGSDTPC